MREILFRGKDTNTGEWVYGDLYQEKHTDKSVTYCIVKPLSTYEVAPNTVGQYTGLTDKKGNKIFEGDIVKMKTKLYGDEIFRIGYEDSHIGAFCLCSDDDDNSRFVGIFGRDYGYEPFYCEVIGNYFDTPELLKGGEE